MACVCWQWVAQLSQCAWGRWRALTWEFTELFREAVESLSSRIRMWMVLYSGNLQRWPSRQGSDSSLPSQRPADGHWDTGAQQELGWCHWARWGLARQTLLWVFGCWVWHLERGFPWGSLSPHPVPSFCCPHSFFPGKGNAPWSFFLKRMRMRMRQQLLFPRLWHRWMDG